MSAERKMADSRLVLAIDPSTTIAGLAVGTMSGHLLHSTLIPASQSEPYIRRTFDIVSTIKHYVDKTVQMPDIIAIELPETWQSPKGIRASTSGAVSVLNFAVGALWWWAKTTGAQVCLVPVSSWKGQLPKEAVLRRLQAKGHGRHLSPSARDMNESDAIGLWDWVVNHADKVSALSTG